MSSKLVLGSTWCLTDVCVMRNWVTMIRKLSSAAVKWWHAKHGTFPCGKKLRNDKLRLILEAVKNIRTFTWVLRLRTLRNDKEVVLEAALKMTDVSLEFAVWGIEKLHKLEKSGLLNLLNTYGQVGLEFASEELRNDKEVVLEAVSKMTDFYWRLRLRNWETAWCIFCSWTLF